MNWTGPWQSGRGMRYWQLSSAHPIWAAIYENKGDTGLKHFPERFYLDSNVGFKKIDAPTVITAKKKAEEFLRKQVEKAHEAFKD